MIAGAQGSSDGGGSYHGGHSHQPSSTADANPGEHSSAASTRDGMPSAATTVVPQEVLANTMNAKLMVATSRDDCQGLKDLVKEEEATTMMVVIATNQAPPPPTPTPAASIIHPLLAEEACKGNLAELNFLLNNGEDLEAQPSQIPIPSQEFDDKRTAYSSGNSTNGRRWATAELLLKGVTVKGDTALHLVAANGEDSNFLKCAGLIHGKDKDLLYEKKNSKGGTPLHCAAKAGRSKMVSHLIFLAQGDNKVEELLRKQNIRNETALHEAVCIGDNDMVQELLRADPELASFPEEGTSPLYLAILIRWDIIADTLYGSSKNHVLSYSGPRGQNALHAAVVRGPGITKKVLEWNEKKELTTERDENGSTPLHLAAGLGRGEGLQMSVCFQLLDANTAALYQADNDGFSPIHVAASVGYVSVVSLFVKKCPSSAALLDARGRTFLHVAVLKRKGGTVRYACRNRSVTWIMNVQDNDGNTALHLAVQAGTLSVFCPLLRNRQVHMSLTNDNGETPLDMARYKKPPGLFSNTNPEIQICRALELADAVSGASGTYYFRQNFLDSQKQKADYEIKEIEKMRDSTQSLSIASVLIASVTFGATFALPGGYTNGGTPTLAGSYSFDAFMVANALAFICSLVATIGLTYSGTPTINMRNRQVYLGTSMYFMDNAIVALVAAFDLGMYTVLAPVAHKTAIAICVITVLVVLCVHVEFLGTWAFLAGALLVRRGPCWTIRKFSNIFIIHIIFENWPLIIIFLWPLIQGIRH